MILCIFHVLVLRARVRVRQLRQLGLKFQEAFILRCKCVYKVAQVPRLPQSCPGSAYLLSCVYSLVIDLFKSFPHFFHCFFFLIIEFCKFCVYSVYKSFIRLRVLQKTTSQCMVCLLILLVVFFEEQKFLILLLLLFQKMLSWPFWGEDDPPDRNKTIISDSPKRVDNYVARS